MRSLRVRPTRWARPAALLATLALLGAACAGGAGTAGEPSPGSSPSLAAQVASADLYTGAPQRLLVGLFAGDGRLLSYGTVSFRISYTGPAGAPLERPEFVAETPARYIPTPGTPAGEGQRPVLTQPSEARGVYQAEGLRFDRPGIYVVQVRADVAGMGPVSAQATFSVAADPALPAPGDRAPRTENLTLRSKGVPRAAIDSGYLVEGKIPDPELHRWTIARAIREHRPALVVFATPAFCVSRFCGPAVSAVQELARRYADRAVFIHVEIWEDYQEQKVNQAAAQWLTLPDGSLVEPWLYLIGPDGVIVDRWGSLWDPAEVAAELEALPS
ncbi:MAG TPA: hypothetical protein VNO79_14790 [Actinomycetota bacterium]|nr:hypothetical protein [Actinomycetota bacterium]